MGIHPLDSLISHSLNKSVYFTNMYCHIASPPKNGGLQYANPISENHPIYLIDIFWEDPHL